MEHPDVPSELTTAAIAASPSLEHFYLQGGGSASDLRTDISYALAAVRLVTVPLDKCVGRVIDLVDRRCENHAFRGPDRRRAADATR